MGKRKTPIPFPESGRLIKEYRIKRGYTAKELATLANMGEKYLSSVESCSQMAGIRYLYNLSICLNVPIEALLTPHTDSPSDDDLKAQITRDLDGLSHDELQLLSALLYQCLPHTRKFHEY